MYQKYAIGCFFNFRRSLIVKAIKQGNKVVIQCEERLNFRINLMGERLRKLAYSPKKIWTQKHPSLNSCFNDRLNQIDFENESAIAELEDIFLSMSDEGVLVFDENFNLKLAHHIKSLHLALKGLDYYKNHTNELLKS